MVNVPASHFNVVKWPDFVMNRDSDSAHDEDGGEETDRCQEEPLSPRLTKLSAVNAP